MHQENRKLTDRQPKQSPATAKAGNSTLSFARRVLDFQPIKEVRKNDPSRLQELKDVFAEAAFLIGIKDPISKPNKDDIVDLIFRRFNGLSIEEVREAFKLDRFGEFGDPTPSFQLFNSEFVGKVLTRYKNWLQKTRHENNLPMRNSTQPKPKELSEEEKTILVFNGAVSCFEDYKATGIIDPGRVYVYEFLYERKALPEHTKEFRSRILEEAKKQAIQETKKKRKEAKGNRIERANLARKIEEIKAGEYQLKTVCRKIILKEFFDGLIAEEKTLNDVLE